MSSSSPQSGQSRDGAFGIIRLLGLAKRAISPCRSSPVPPCEVAKLATRRLDLMPSRLQTRRSDFGSLGIASRPALARSGRQGWESRYVVVGIGPGASDGETGQDFVRNHLAAVYVALSRVKAVSAGSWLTVFNADRSLDRFVDTWFVSAGQGNSPF